MVKIPGDDPIELLLPILTAFNGIPSHVRRHVSVQPLLSQHCEESREQRSGEAGVQDRLDVNDHAWRAGPSGDGGNVVTESGVVDLVDEDTEQGRGLFVGVRLELGANLDDESGGDCGKQTSICSGQHIYVGATCKTHEDQRCVQILVVSFVELLVVFLGHLAVTLVEFGTKILWF